MKVSRENKHNLVNDLNRAVTLNVITRLLEGRSIDALRDTTWQQNTMRSIAGLMTYQEIFHRFDTSCCKQHQGLVDDIIKSTCILVVGSLMKGDDITSVHWLKNFAVVVAAIAGYHIYIVPHVRTLLKNTKMDIGYAEDWLEDTILFAISNQMSGNLKIDTKFVTRISYNVIGLGVYHLLIKDSDN